MIFQSGYFLIFNPFVRKMEKDLAISMLEEEENRTVYGFDQKKELFIMKIRMLKHVVPFTGSE